MLLKKMVSELDLYDIRKPRSDWKKWTEDLSPIKKKYVQKIRNSLKYLEYETGIKVIEVVLPKNPQGLWWMDYPLSYAKSLYPNMETNGKAYMIVIYKLDEHKHLFLDGLRSSIKVQHWGIKRRFKKNFEEYMLDFTNSASINDPKLYWGPKNSDLIYFYM